MSRTAAYLSGLTGAQKLDIELAETLARWMHRDQVDKAGERYVGHLERVAAAVPADAQTIAWLHDIVDDTDLTFDALRALFDDDVVAAVELLSRTPVAPPVLTYKEHIERIATEPGERGRLCRCVKRADLRDHLCDGRRVSLSPSMRARYEPALERLERGREIRTRRITIR